MKSIEDKGCRGEENAGGGSSCMILDLKKSGSRPSPHHRSSLGKAAPSKWDDAQKWLVNLSRSEGKDSPRDSNADDRHLMASACRKEGDEKYKNVECDESVGRARAICLRDMGTEMTPVGSKEPSRAATPIRAVSPTMSSGSCSPVIPEAKVIKIVDKDDLNPSEARAAAWEEAQRANYMARYKRQAMRIEAWENHEKNKAEMENRKAEVKAEQQKSRAKEKCNQKIATSRRIAEEKRAVAEAKLNQNAINTSQTGDYIRRNHRLPSSFSFNFNLHLPSCSCCRRR